MLSFNDISEGASSSLLDKPNAYLVLIKIFSEKSNPAPKPSPKPIAFKLSESDKR